MDDQNNGSYSRTPEIKDLVSVCRLLNEQDAKYILIGGFAVIIHGFARTTKDIDFLVDSDSDNIEKIKKALSALPDNAISQMKSGEVAQYSVVRVADEIVIDLMAKACGIDYDNASTEVEVYNLHGVQIPIASKEMLIRMKDTIRPSDKMDVEFLKVRINEENTESVYPPKNTFSLINWIKKIFKK